MRYKLLGRSGLRVSEVALGALTFGNDWGWGSEIDESRAVFEAFAEAGGNFIDTANIYSDGNSERFLGRFIKSDRERFIVATKYTGAVGMYSANAGAGERAAVRRPLDGDIGASGNSRRNMVRSVEASLRRLDVDYIDLLYVHFWDYTTSIDEVMRALDDLVSAGKVIYVAFSDTPAWVTARASLLADLRGWAPLVAIQLEYSLIERTPERELLPMARELDLAVVPWGPLGGGVLSGKYVGAPNADGTASAPRLDPSSLPPRHRHIAEELASVAAELGAGSAPVALAWLRRQAERWGVVIPLIGARTPRQLQENLACLEIELSDEHLERLDRASEIEPGFPTSMLETELITNLRFSGKRHLLDNHRGG